MTRGTYDPMSLAGRDFAAEFPDLFDRYIELRVEGVPSHLAVIEAFELIPNGISLDNVEQLGLACDVNPYVKEGVKALLARSDIRDDLWTQRRSVHSLIKMVEDPRVRDSTRLNAIVHLNVMLDYVTLDELTTKRVDKTISEFKRQHEAWLAAGSPTGQAATH